MLHMTEILVLPFRRISNLILQLQIAVSEVTQNGMRMKYLAAKDLERGCKIS